MNTKRGAVIAVVILLVVIALVASEAVLSSPISVNNPVYTIPGSAVRASLHKSASDGTIALRLNGVSDASNPAIRYEWITFSRQSGVYNFSLAPPPGNRYVVANVTVMNVHHTAVPFTYTRFVLISQDNIAYYPNYALCDHGCSDNILENRTLNATFTSDLHVLFSVPTTTRAAKLAYTVSTPPVVLSTS